MDHFNNLPNDIIEHIMMIKHKIELTDVLDDMKHRYAEVGGWQYMLNLIYMY